MSQFSSLEAGVVINSTMPHYISGFVDLTIRSRLLLSMMRQKGRITLNESGDFMDWKVKYSLPTMETYDDGQVVDFSNHNSLRALALDWRGYTARDAMTQKQKYMNSGARQLVNQFQLKQNNLRQAITEGFCGELFGDGSASDSGKRIHGLETFLAAGGTTVATDRIATPSDTYGLGLASTALGDQGGYWNTTGATNNAALANTWPDGPGSHEYDHLSPKLVNWSSTSWGTNSALWEDNSWRVTSALCDWLTHTNGMDGGPDILLYSNDMFRGYKHTQEAKTRINLPHRQSQDLGFDNNKVLNHDGVAIHVDFDVPVGVGYALNLDHMRLRSITPTFFYNNGPSQDPHTMWSDLFATGFFGNLEVSPKHQGKTAAYA